MYDMNYDRKQNRYHKIIYNHIENMQTYQNNKKRRLRRRFWAGGRFAPARPICCFGMIAYFLYGCI